MFPSKDAGRIFRPNETIQGRRSQYQIVGECVKNGGFSEVYKAVDTGGITGGLVAIKVIDLQSKKIKRNDHEKRIKSECEIHKRLEDHNRVIRFIECFQPADRYFCIVLEWAENGDLKDYLKQQGGQLAEAEISRIVSQIAEGLVFFQKNNLVHRDFKLQNILLDKNRNIKITDFGLATELAHRNERMNTFCGTPNYLPPEMISRNGYSSKVDIWSLGVLLYQLLVGRPPVEGENAKETMRIIPISDIYIPELASEHAKDIIRKTLEKNPTKRINIDDLLEHPFLRAHRRERAMSDISDIQNRHSQYSNLKSGSNSMINNNQYHQGPLSSRSSSRRSSCSEEGRNSGRNSRSRSVERVPSREYMPPPVTVPINTTRDPSTGYGSALSQNTSGSRIDTSGSRSARISPRSGPAGRSHPHHTRQRSLPNSTSSTSPHVPAPPANTTLPQINIRRLVPTRDIINKNICHIINDQRVVIESLDEIGLIRSCILIECLQQICTYYEPRGLNNERYRPREDPYLPDHDRCYKQIHRYPNIPKSIQKKWLYLHRYTQLIRSKTVKIRIFTDLGEAILMENDSFELNFHDGSKFIQSNPSQTIYRDALGQERSTKDNDVISTMTQQHLGHARLHMKSARRIESAIEDIMGAASSGFEYFPIAVGRRVKTESNPGQRPRSAPSKTQRSNSPRTPRSSCSNIAYVSNNSPTSTAASTPSNYPTPPSTFTTSCRSNSASKKSKILFEFDFTTIPEAPILYGCFKSNGNLEFQSGRNYFIDKTRKQEIRIRNGETITYRQTKAGRYEPNNAGDLQTMICWWLNNENGRQRLLAKQ